MGNGHKAVLYINSLYIKSLFIVLHCFYLLCNLSLKLAYVRIILCYSVESVCRRLSVCLRNVLWLNRPWTLFRGRIKVMSTITSHSPLNMKRLCSKGPPIGNGLWVSNVHVIYDVTWPRKVKRASSMKLESAKSRKQLEMLFRNNR